MTLQDTSHLWWYCSWAWIVVHLAKLASLPSPLFCAFFGQKVWRDDPGNGEELQEGWRGKHNNRRRLMGERDLMFRYKAPLKRMLVLMIKRWLVGPSPSLTVRCIFGSDFPCFHKRLTPQSDHVLLIFLAWLRLGKRPSRVSIVILSYNTLLR